MSDDSIDPRAITDPYEAIAAATEAAKASEAGLVVELLVRSGYTSSLVRRIQQRYRGLDVAVCEEVVAEGVAAVYKAVAERRLVSNPAPYLLRVATVHAGQESQRLHGQVSTDDIDDRDEYRTLDSEESPDVRNRLKAEALRIARAFVMQLGLETLQRVMTVIFDAIELGHVTITNAEIAEILDLDEVVVRQARSRGFRRLERLAREQGYGDRLQDIEPEPDEEDD